jgi:SAM-dependent methyltransferase
LYENYRGNQPMPNLPPRHLLMQQADWLAPARSKLLRQSGIGRRKRLLDLGSGPGAVTEELARRSNGNVVALDCLAAALAAFLPSPIGRGTQRVPGGEGRRTKTSPFPPEGKPEVTSDMQCVCGDARRLPFDDAAFDLVFTQFSLLWMNIEIVVPEIARVLQPDGVCVAIEPDYGGMIEHPPEIALQPVWQSALARAGADPHVGRKLPSLFTRSGFTIQVDFLDRLFPPSAARYDLLAGLPLTPEENDIVELHRAAEEKLSPRETVVFLPLFLITADKPMS